MKKLFLVVASLMVLLLVVAACAASTPESTSTTGPMDTDETPVGTQPEGKIGEGRKLVVGIWGAIHEEIARDITIPLFEKETGATVELILGNSVERNALLYAEIDNPSMDVAYINMAQTEAAWEAGAVQPANPQGVTEYVNLYEPAKVSGGYGVAFSAIGLMYSTEVFSEAPSSWRVCWDEEYKGLVALRVFPGSAQGEAWIVMASKLHGGDEINLEPGIEATMKLKPIPLFFSGTSDLNLAFENGDCVLAPQIGGYAYSFQDEGGKVDFVVPEEGGFLSMDCAVIPKNTKNADLAEVWINIHLGQEVQQAYAERLYFGPTNSTVVLDDDLAKKVVYGTDEVAQLSPIDNKAITENQAKWAELWNTLIVE